MKNSIKSLFYPVLLAGTSFLSPQSADAQAVKQEAHDLAGYQKQFSEHGYVPSSSKLVGRELYKGTQKGNGGQISEITLYGADDDKNGKIDQSEIDRLHLLKSSTDSTSGNGVSVELDIGTESIRMETVFLKNGAKVTRAGRLDDEGDGEFDVSGDFDARLGLPSDSNCKDMTNAKTYKAIKDGFISGFLDISLINPKEVAERKYYRPLCFGFKK